MRANITDCNVIKCLLLQGGTIEKASSHLGVVENGNTRLKDYMVSGKT